MTTMEVPEEILQVLKCSKCQGLLSRGPVFLCPDGGGLCNACHLAAPFVPATRNTHYEAVANLLLFPCRHQDDGCTEKAQFSDEGVCSVHQYVCPMLGTAACEWSGSATAILDHCQQQHQDRIVSSPLTLTHDITKSNSHTYLLQALNVLFLLFTKVCITSGKIYYSVRYLGNSSEAGNFKYTVNITRQEETITKKGQVVPKGCLAIEEHASLVVNINSLLEILGAFSNTTFTVTLEKFRGMDTCVKCNFLLTVRDYHDSEGWICEYCAPKKTSCHNCGFICFEIKRPKHTYYFCKSPRRCDNCWDVKEPFLIHHEKEHLTCSNGSSWRAGGNGSVTCVIQSEEIKAVCVYVWYRTEFYLSVYTPLSNDELTKYRCNIKVTQVATGQTRTYNPDTVYHENPDWQVKITNKDFYVWSDNYDVAVTINKYK